MNVDDETTATQLHVLITNLGYHLSLRTILRCRTTLGWTFRGSAYYQLIREANKTKRLEWARKYKDDDSLNVFTDESSVSKKVIAAFVVRSGVNRPKQTKVSCGEFMLKC